MTERFRVQEEIGRGGMATVVRAQDIVLGRTVAIKRLHRHIAADPAAARRFRREALSGAALTHPGIVTVFDAGEDADGPFIVMEFVRGKTLTQVIGDGRRLDLERAVAIAVQVADALDHAHGRGVIHRDVKPGNILIDESGHAKLADFGIAATMDEQARTTVTGEVLGTIAYLAPERLAAHPATPAADLYALGVVLYQMVTGRLPFEAGSPEAMAEAHRSLVPKAPGSLVPVPPDLERIILRAVANEPGERFRSAGEFARRLRSWREGIADTIALTSLPDPAPTVPLEPAATGPLSERAHGIAGAPHLPRPPADRSRRSPWPVLAGILVMGALVLAVLGSSSPGETPPADHGEPGETPERADTPSLAEVTTAPLSVEEAFRDLERMLLGGLDSGELHRRVFEELRKHADKAHEEWRDGDREDTAKELARFDDTAIEEFSRGRISSLTTLEALLDQTELIRELGGLPVSR
jgi:eukaryotic-like serine/threonine-protein kinase